MDPLRRRPFWRRPGFWVVAFAFVLYNVNLRYAVGGDEAPNRLLPLAVLKHGTLSLDPFVDDISSDGVLPYYAVEHGGSVISEYSPGTALVALPFYIPALFFGREVPALLLAKLAASGMCALAVGLVYASLRRLGAGSRAAAALALVFGFATPVYSVASLSLNQHSAGTLAIAAAAYAAARFSILDEDSARAPRWALLAGLASGAVLAIRPQLVGAVLPLVGYVLWKSGRDRWRVAAGAIPLPLALIVYNLASTGRVGGGYALANERFGSLGLREMSLGGNPLIGVPGLLVSPGRGVLIFAPIVFFSAVGFVRALKKKNALLIGAGFGVLATLVIFGTFTVWWGGFSYGPRYLTEVMPLVALLWLPVVWAPSLLSHRRWAASFVALTLVSVFVQAVGAFAAPCGWDSLPVSVDQAPERNWDPLDTPTTRCLGKGLEIGGTGLLDLYPS